MRVWTDRKGKPVTAREFVSRWKGGIQKITPLQITKFQIMGNLFMLVGILIGLWVSWGALKWLFIILTGSLFLVSMQMISTLQRYIMISNIKKVKEEFIQKELEGGLSYVT